jgi:uncharacterized protein with ParB-like and HNH nuclease domain
VKDLYNKNYKTLKKEIEDTERWKDLICSCIARINTVKMGHITENDLQIQHNSHQNSNDILTEIEKIPNPVEAQKIPNNQSNPEQKQQC